MADNVSKSSRINLDWEGGEAFRATSAAGSEIVLDGDAENGFSPMQALVTSLGACMGIDVIIILTKMRADLKRLRVALEGERRQEPPRYFERLRVKFEIAGGVPAAKAERAVKLSREKYCSVLHTLRPDLMIETSFEILER
jgi:putative redox protein